MLTIIIVAIGFTACSSDDSDDAQEVNYSITKRLVRFTEGGNRFYDYSYDSQGRVVKIQYTGIYSTGEKISKTCRSYNYDKNTITETIIDGGITYQVIYTLENNKITKVQNGDNSLTYLLHYENGYLVLAEEHDRQTKYTWSNGNLMKIGSGAKETFEYTNFNCPQGFMGWGWRNVPMCDFYGMSNYLGKSMKNLPSKYQEDNYIETYDWTVEDGLPVKMVKKTNNWGDGTVYTFEWL